MPQTLLAISAIVITGFLTLSQGEISRRTSESVVTDQFELAVAGTLLHTMEFVDSRAFDEATTPEKLRQRLGLPTVMTSAERDTISFDDLQMIKVTDFGTVGSFGTGNCDVKNPPPSCDDVDDIADGKWHALDLETPEGDPLPVEVKVEVAYVEAAAGKAIDEPVADRTFHKRVEVLARSNAIRLPEGGSRPIQVALRRVISFDPEVAAEYLRRSILVTDDGPASCEAQVGPWNSRMAELRDALQSAQEADRAAALTVSNAESARAEAQQRAEAATARQTDAQRAADAAAVAVAAADAAAQRASDDHNTAIETARRSNETRDAAKTTSEKAAAAAESARTNAASKKTAYDNAVTKVNQTKTSFDTSVDELVPLLNRYTTYRDGSYYRNSGTTDAQWNQVLQSHGRYIAARDAYNGAVTTRNAAQTASTTADSELAAAQNDATSKAAAYNNARSAAERAAQAVADANAAVDPARQSATAARDASASAIQSLTDAQNAARAAADAATAAQGPLDNARAAAAETGGDAAAAAQAVRDHKATQPQCDDQA